MEVVLLLLLRRRRLRCYVSMYAMQDVSVPPPKGEGGGDEGQYVTNEDVDDANANDSIMLLYV